MKNKILKMILKAKSKNIISSVRTVLVNDWDPIEIGDNSNLFDEYDSYIGPIITMLRQNSTVEELVAFLEKTERTEMELSDVNIKRLHDVAVKLKNINIS